MLSVVQDPELRLAHEAYATMNMEGDGKDGLREFGRQKLVQMGVLDPTEDDIEKMEAEAEAAGPNPQEELALSMAEKEKAEAEKLRVDNLETVSKARLNEANAEKVEIENLQSAQKPPEPDAAPTEDPEDAKAIMEAVKLRAEIVKQQEEIELKQREVELKEQEQVLRAEKQKIELAKLGFDIKQAEGEIEKGAISEGAEIAEDMAEDVSSATSEGENA